MGLTFLYYEQENILFYNYLFLILRYDCFLDGCFFKVDSLTAHFGDFRQVKIVGHLLTLNNSNIP